MAIKHTHHLFKIENRGGDTDMNKKTTDIYVKNGWLTTDQTVLDLLKDGYDNFERTVALRILKEYPHKIFMNKCPQCNRLARTPYAKQCKYCKFDWHS